MTPAEAFAEHEDHGLSADVPNAPEEWLVFRLAQLALLLDVAMQENVAVSTVDRLGYYDFLAANPFIVCAGQDERDKADQLLLRLAGFSSRQLSYASAGARFASRRRRLQHDLALLVGYGLVELTESGYTLTTQGHEIAESLSTVYADSYRAAAVIVIRRLKRLSDKKLRETAEEWLGKSWLYIDFLDDINETTPYLPSTATRERTRHGRRR